jgi:hypothetical protein
MERQEVIMGFAFLGRLVVAGLVLAPSASAGAESPEQKFDEINALARAHYAEAKTLTLASLGPVIIVDADALTLVRAGTLRRETYLPVRYRDLKAIGHLAMGLYSLLVPHADKPGIAAWRGDLVTYRERAAELAPLIGDLGLHWEDAKRQREIITASLELMDSVLERDGVTTAELRAYADGVGPALLGNVYDAADAELTALHMSVQRWRAELGEAEWARVHVVVLGPTRPRERHAPYEYFARLLGPEAAGTRLIYADNVTDVAGALDLLAATVTDRQLAEYFFADTTRFDRGLLRDATTRHLDRLLPR